MFSVVATYSTRYMLVAKIKMLFTSTLCLSLFCAVASTARASQLKLRITPISVHIIDIERGMPGTDTRVRLDRYRRGEWVTLGNDTTDAQGRVVFSMPPQQFVAGDYRVIFYVKNYLHAQGRSSIFPNIPIPFRISNVNEHYHIPLLLSANGYSTYRGN